MTEKELQKALRKLVKKKECEYYIAKRDGNMVTVRFWVEDKE